MINRFRCTLLRVCTFSLCGLIPAFMACSSLSAQEQKYVIADQDASGPAGSDMMALLVFLQSPQVKLLGITVVTGDAWRDEELAHTLRLLELVGRTDVKVYPGAEYPLVRTQQETHISEQLYGRSTWLGAGDRKSTRLNSSHYSRSRMPSSA